MTAAGDHRTGATPATDPAQPREPDQSVGDLISRVGGELSDLMSTELEIAKLEIKQEATKVAKGAGMLSGGAVAGFLALFFLSTALAWGIAEELDWWASFLIVGLLWAAIAAVLGYAGKDKLNEAGGPERTMAELRADRELATTRQAPATTPSHRRND